MREVHTVPAGIFFFVIGVTTCAPIGAVEKEAIINNGSASSSPPALNIPIDPKVENNPVEKEERFTIVFLPANNDPKSVGAIELSESPFGGWRLMTTRPGDAMIMNLGDMQSRIGMAEGSEIRFSGRVKTNEGAVVTNDYLRFRMADGKWAYVDGLGQFEAAGNTTKLGYNRTVDSCLELLKSPDPILREGGARDLGRLSKPTDAGRVVPQLIPMLKDASPWIRRGAIESLGMIGTAESSAALERTIKEETDKTTIEYLEGSLIMATAFAILGEPGVALQPPEAGLDILLGKGNTETRAAKNKAAKKEKVELKAWVKVHIEGRIADHREAAMLALKKAAAADSPRVAKAAVFLKSSLQTPDERERERKAPTAKAK